jgi:hypothetical protein
MNKINSAIFEKLHSASFRHEFRPNVSQAEGSCKSKPVWVIGAWNLYIICYLLFGAWNFFYLKTRFLHVVFNFLMYFRDTKLGYLYIQITLLHFKVMPIQRTRWRAGLDVAVKIKCAAMAGTQENLFRIIPMNGAPQMGAPAVIDHQRI